MAYVVPRKAGSWELRESSSTPAGPRSRTLASFRSLAPEVVTRARRRARKPLSEADVRRAAERAGAPVARDAPDEAAARLLTELSAGRAPSPALRRLLLDALGDLDGVPNEAERSAAPWIAATPKQRGEALRDLLLLADRLPTPTRPRTTRFPRVAS